MVICQGCGQYVEIPEGYSRNKIQCPGCGVICAVDPAAVGAKKPARAGKAASSSETEDRPRTRSASRASQEDTEDLANDFLRDPEPMPLMDDEPEPPPRRTSSTKPQTRKPAENRIPCRRCGKMILRQRECPNCDDVDGETPLSEEPTSPSREMTMELEEPLKVRADDDEDDSPYILADKDKPICPKCKKDLAEGAVLCTSCGYDLQRRKKVARTYEPIHQVWDADMSIQTRLMWLAGGILFHVAVVGSIMMAGATSVEAFLSTGFCMASLLAFVVGTYDRITITRDRKGRAKVIKQWHFAFVPLQPVETEVRGFEGVTTGQWLSASFWEWFIFAGLLVYFIVPGALWWYYIMHKPYFHVALAQDHGHAEFYVYRGHSQEQTNAIAETLCNAAGLRRLV